MKFLRNLNDDILQCVDRFMRSVCIITEYFEDDGIMLF